MNHLSKYVPKIKFLGKRSLLQQHKTNQAPYIHKFVDYQRLQLSEEEIEAINQGGIENVKWKKVKGVKL